MEIRLDINKSLEQNAEIYFEKAKKAKKKLKGAKEALKKSIAKLELLKKQEIAETEVKKIEKIQREKQWFEKFRWFYSSEGFLCIGGRDATTNEIVIKKHTLPEDIVFHTEMPGSPFFVIKTQGKKPGEATLNEVAQATASYSKAWKLGVTYAETYCVAGDGVRKDIGLPKGSFMIHGKRQNFRPILKIAIGIKDRQIIGGPIDAIKANAEKFVIITQGELKASDAAKKILKKLNAGELDDIIRFLPAGKYSLQ